MRTFRTSILYIAYIGSAAIFFLYYLFPSDIVRGYIVSQIGKQIPALQIGIREIRPSLPPGLSIIGLDLVFDGETLIVADRLKLSPTIGSLFGDVVSLNFGASASGGGLNGRIDFSRANPGERMSLEATLAGIQLQNFSFFRDLEGHKLTGLLGGNVKFENQGGSKQKGNADVRVSEFMIQLSAPIFGIDYLTFKAIEADAILADQVLQITQCTLKGPEMDGKLSGTISLKNPIEESLLNLTGTVKPHHQFLAAVKKTMPVISMLSQKRAGDAVMSFKIDGLLKKPAFSLI
jgi:type II secretion system protein N